MLFLLGEFMMSFFFLFIETEDKTRNKMKLFPLNSRFICVHLVNIFISTFSKSSYINAL